MQNIMYTLHTYNVYNVYNVCSKFRSWVGESIPNCEEILSALNTSKHLKDQLDSPSSDKKCV